jgi:hypothetical protein
MDVADLYQFTRTDHQRTVLDAVAEHGSYKLASESLGIHIGGASALVMRLRKEAARQGHAPGHFESGTAPGYRMGKVTVQRGPGGAVERTWERQSPETGEALDALQAALGDVLHDFTGKLPTVAPPTAHDADLLTLIPLGDPHFGLLTWAEEVGENFDLKIAESLTFAAVDRLCALTPSSEVAMLLNLGDFYHADNSTNRTPKSGASLDVDGRFQLIARVGLRAMVRCVRRLLEKHAKVIVRNNRGNHDPHQAYMLTLALDAMFHDEPRVEVDMTPASFYYYRFGKTLIGSTHGDGAKLTDLPLIMATDAAQDWAAATWRVWHCGHFHHDQLKDHPGCTVETHRTLAANDAWHRHAGYRSGRDAKAIIYHREHGEVSRIRCGMSQLREAA